MSLAVVLLAWGWRQGWRQFPRRQGSEPQTVRTRRHRVTVGGASALRAQLLEAVHTQGRQGTRHGNARDGGERQQVPAVRAGRKADRYVAKRTKTSTFCPSENSKIAG